MLAIENAWRAASVSAHKLVNTAAVSKGLPPELVCPTINAATPPAMTRMRSSSATNCLRNSLKEISAATERGVTSLRVVSDGANALPNNGTLSTDMYPSPDESHS